MQPLRVGGIDALVLGVIRVLPVGNASADARPPATARCRRSEVPARLARGRIQRSRLQLRGLDIHDPVDHDGLTFYGGGRPLAGVLGVVYPSHLQPLDVRRIDLVERLAPASPPYWRHSRAGSTVAFRAPGRRTGSVMLTAASAALRVRNWRRFGFCLCIALPYTITRQQ